MKIERNSTVDVNEVEKGMRDGIDLEKATS